MPLKGLTLRKPFQVLVVFIRLLAATSSIFHVHTANDAPEHQHQLAKQRGKHDVRNFDGVFCRRAAQILTVSLRNASFRTSSLGSLLDPPKSNMVFFSRALMSGADTKPRRLFRNPNSRSRSENPASHRGLRCAGPRLLTRSPSGNIPASLAPGAALRRPSALDRDQGRRAARHAPGSFKRPWVFSVWVFSCAGNLQRL